MICFSFLLPALWGFILKTGAGGATVAYCDWLGAARSGQWARRGRGSVWPQLFPPLNAVCAESVCSLRSDGALSSFTEISRSRNTKVMLHRHRTPSEAEEDERWQVFTLFHSFHQEYWPFSSFSLCVSRRRVLRSQECRTAFSANSLDFSLRVREKKHFGVIFCYFLFL